MVKSNWAGSSSLGLGLSMQMGADSTTDPVVMKVSSPDVADVDPIRTASQVSRWEAQPAVPCGL